MDKVKIGQIGLGFMGTTHYRIHNSLPYAQVTAVADVEEEKRKGDISSVIGNIGNDDNSKPLDFSNVEVYDDPLEMIQKADIDIVDITVPTPWHAEYILAALKAGKHVFSEKPLCRNLEEMQQIQAAVQASDKFFNCGLCVRAWPEYNYLYEQMKAGAYGKLLVANFRRLSPTTEFNLNWKNWYMNADWSGGAILDLHLHDTDFITYLIGKPKAVTSFGRNLNSDHGIDHVVTRYEYGDGTLVLAEGGWGAARSVPFEMSFQVIFEKATVRLEPSGQLKVYWTDGKIDTITIDTQNLPTGWHQELAYFDKCVLDGVTPDKYQTPQSVFDSYRVLCAERESVAQGKTIAL